MGLRGTGIGAIGAVAAVTVTCAVPPAAADPVLSTSVTTQGSLYVYRLQARAPARDERFHVKIALPCYAGCRNEPVGFVLSERSAGLVGPGSRAGLFEFATPSLAAGTCVRGALGSTTGATLSVPAGATQTLVLRYRPLRPWDTTSYRIRFTVTGGASMRRRTILSPAPDQLERRRAVRFALTRSPGPGAREVRLGSPIRIVGTTERALAGRLVRLRFRHDEDIFAGVDEPATRHLATVRVNSRGRFHYRWRPVASGAYTVAAAYGGDRRRVRDTSCPIRFSVAP